MAHESMCRLFVGIPLATGVRRHLLAARKALAVPGNAVRWVPEANLHLTVKFIGAVPCGRVDGFSQGLARVLAGWPALAARVDGLLLLPGARRPRVVAAGVTGGEPLLQLAECVEEWALGEGVAREKRGFTPHVTLGRVRNPGASLPGLARGRIMPLAWEMDRVCLYESRLTPTGAVYRVRRTVTLKMP
ncbi:RNA 2',3'-cyclic phosphodiesterase [Desulfoluna butyratoxydans]|uniref:RNA 2',3'-cyclic phosphodiesterase n=1 Tax=Desulfoluna butyratoxydans TaxID=231438 RepID=A0A4U8YJP0_9BACT|nr:RNA 2',3'-cyclic phosphodiesterase [Desulfoluna butyratoxydans]VFQ43650.1 cyclic phosphodiesterase [Desulfoluna butyratoxydans]